jgi:hypothetical protein
MKEKMKKKNFYNIFVGEMIPSIMADVRAVDAPTQGQ